jgi:hypothetical protein
LFKKLVLSQDGFDEIKKGDRAEDDFIWKSELVVTFIFALSVCC